MTKTECAEQISQLNGVIMLLLNDVLNPESMRQSLIHVSDRMDDLYVDLMCTCEGDDEDNVL